MVGGGHYHVYHQPATILPTTTVATHVATATGGLVGVVGRTAVAVAAVVVLLLVKIKLGRREFLLFAFGQRDGGYHAAASSGAGGGGDGGGGGEG